MDDPRSLPIFSVLLLLTASHLELARVRVERVVVEHHATRDGDADPATHQSERTEIRLAFFIQMSDFHFARRRQRQHMKGFC